jgi:hypothetical protein
LAFVLVTTSGSAQGQSSPEPLFSPSIASWPLEREVEPSIESQVEQSIDIAQLNLWAPSGRARTFVDRETREALKSVQIIDRPRRPLHFYGNAVRRRHHRDATATNDGPR